MGASNGIGAARRGVKLTLRIWGGGGECLGGGVGEPLMDGPYWLQMSGSICPAAPKGWIYLRVKTHKSMYRGAALHQKVFMSSLCE